MTPKKRHHRAFVAFGSNRGRRLASVERAIAGLAAVEGIQVRRASPLYETRPVGGPAQGPFLNGVLEIRTTLSPRDLLARLLALEKRLGRRRGVRWGPRTIDLDLLTYGTKRITTSRLTVPHPRYHERRFVLAPFCDLAPHLRHPALGRQNRWHLRRLPPGGQRVTMVGTWKKSRYRLFSRKNKRARRSSR